MTFPSIRVTIAALVICATAPVTAYAQIYSWHDAAGNLVLSDKPHDGATQTFPVASGSTLRTTRAASQKLNTTYDTLIQEHAQTHGLRADLVRAVIQAESAFNPMARSPKGAMGLMQLMPATAFAYGVANPFDAAQNIRAGVAYLKSLMERYKQNEELALAAYNAGPGAVEKYGAVPPYRETRDYVSRIQNQAGTPRAPAHIYKVVELKDGREIVRYTTTPPPTAGPSPTPHSSAGFNRDGAG
ncbi:MAG: transglycosylase SLT domain-containing protein [Acidobacteriota bacterium]